MTIPGRALRRASLSLLSLALVATALAATTVSPAVAANSSKLTITGTEYTYKLSGSAKPGNTEIVFDNAGIEIHMAVAIQLKPSVTLKQLKAALASDDDAALEKLATGQGFNVPGMPGLNSPGVTTTNITSLKAGHYAMLCFVPDAEGAPHIVHGMVQLFDVKGAKSTLKPPTDGVVDITITDSGVTLPSAGVPKSGWIKVTNESSEPRDFTLAKYEGSNTDFATVDAAVSAFFETGKWSTGAAPVLLNGGVGTLGPNGIGYLEVTSLPSGKWVAVSSGNEDDSSTFHTDFSIA